MGKKIAHQPKIFNVNWFRTDSQGHFVWPGFGDNFRVLEWILKRCNDQVEARNTPIGFIPYAKDISIDGLDNFTEADVEGLLSIEQDVWAEEIKGIEDHFAKFDRLPTEMTRQLTNLKARFE